MKRVAVISLLCVLAWCQVGWAGGRQACPPSQEGITDIIVDILLAPCSLLAECLGVSRASYGVPWECRQAPAPPAKVRKKRPSQPSERPTPRRKQSTTDLGVPKREGPQEPPPTQRPPKAPLAPRVSPPGPGPERQLPKPKAQEVVPRSPGPVTPGVQEYRQPSQKPGAPSTPPPSGISETSRKKPGTPSTPPPSGISETSRKKPGAPAVQAPEKGPVPTAAPPEKTERKKRRSGGDRGPGGFMYPRSGCYPPPFCR